MPFACLFHRPRFLPLELDVGTQSDITDTPVQHSLACFVLVESEACLDGKVGS